MIFSCPRHFLGVKGVEEFKGFKEFELLRSRAGAPSSPMSQKRNDDL
jgi:hypothetical protein